MNAIGICAIIGFFIGFIGSVVTYYFFYPLTKPVGDANSSQRTWDRNDPKAQRLFYIFVGFSAFGVLSVIAGFQFGGFPYDDTANVDPRILGIVMLFPVFVLAWVAAGLWKLRDR